MAPKKRAQVIRGSRKFLGTDPLTANDLKRLQVKSFSGAAGVFLENWERDPTFLVGLTLSQNNENIENAQALLQGDIWTEGRTYEASLFWHLEKKDILLCFDKLDLEKFDFDGVCASRFLDHNSIDYTVKVKGDDKPLTPAELKSMGFPGFCLRAFCHPISTSVVKVALLLFPLERELLVKENNLAVHYYFPGVVMEKFEVELGIQCDELLDNNYGCPILPVLLSKEPIKSTSKVPSREDIIYAIGTLLRATRAPDCKATYATCLKSWGQLKKHGESKLKHPKYDDWYWPKPKDPEAQTGTRL